MGKSERSEVLRKILVMRKMDKKGHFCAKNQHFISPNLCIELNVMTGIIEWVKETVFDI